MREEYLELRKLAVVISKIKLGTMDCKCFLLDGMALVYRAHFALARNPIMTSEGRNTSSIYGIANTLVDILSRHQPTHLAVVFDTSAPTFRHEAFPEYKAQRQAMPEDLSAAIPEVKRLVHAFGIPILEMDGWEADDLIGTLAHRFEQDLQKGQISGNLFMVTPDKDFGQLVTLNCRLYRPGLKGAEEEIWGPKEVTERWGIERVDQVIDMLGLMGDAVDNIPGIPGVGEKTAAKLLKEFGSLHGVLENAENIKGKLGEKVQNHQEQAKLSYELAKISLDAPLEVSWKELEIRDWDKSALEQLFTEFEFNALGRRLLGEDFKAGRGYKRPLASNKIQQTNRPSEAGELNLFSPQALSTSDAVELEETEASPTSQLKTIADTEHVYRTIKTPECVRDLCQVLERLDAFCFDTETTSLDPVTADILGVSFSWQAHEAVYIDCTTEELRKEILAILKPLFENPKIEKIGHNLKFDLRVLLAQGIEVRGPLFDTMLAHSLLEPDQRHGMDFLSERFLGYTPIPITKLIGEKKSAQGQLSMELVAEDQHEALAEYAAEDADVTWQLSQILKHTLRDSGLASVAGEIEMPLVRVLAHMEQHGIKVDVQVLRDLSHQMAKELSSLQEKIYQIAGVEFNLKSPKQLGEVLFDRLKLLEKPKKTKTGQYKTDEEVLNSLAPKCPLVSDILTHRELSKLKSTYTDALQHEVNAKSGRIHTSYHQLLAATGRLASSDPNLQNIPIRTAQGRELRKAFVPGDRGWKILSADYSQIELRIMASLSGDEAMREAFAQNLDIHTSTASRVFGVPLDEVLPEMRRTAKMVNFGIIYGISAFGLSQRLGIGRREAMDLIETYFLKYPGIKSYMEKAVQLARETGYASTLMGRTRLIRDILSANANTAAAAERMAINTPVQGTAADMIKIAMIRIHDAMKQSVLRGRMLLQVHDELIFETPEEEIEPLAALVKQAMVEALPLDGVPIVVEMGTGEHWLAAH